MSQAGPSWVCEAKETGRKNGSGSTYYSISSTQPRQVSSGLLTAFFSRAGAAMASDAMMATMIIESCILVVCRGDLGGERVYALL